MSPVNADASIQLCPYPSGETLWKEGDPVQPLRLRQGVVLHRKGEAVLGLVGPGQPILPLPGFARPGRAATEVMALTDTVAEPEAEENVTDLEREHSLRVLMRASGRMGNLTIPARLAALLLEVTELQGQPVIHCRQDLLALGVGSRRETVAVILSEWRDYDWIQTRYRRVKVVNREVLRKIASGEAPPPAERIF